MIPGQCKCGGHQTLDRLLPQDTIVTNSAGNYATWVHPFSAIASLSRPMAFHPARRLPARWATEVPPPSAPRRDHQTHRGGLRGRWLQPLTGQGLLSAAVHHDLAVVFIVVNNGMYSAIRIPGAQISRPRLHGAR